MFTSPVIASTFASLSVNSAQQSLTREVEIPSARKPRLAMTRGTLLLSIAVLLAVVLVIYHSALRLNFYGDDYSFLEIAGRSSLAQYLAFYFDPRLQTGWYRPLQGMVFGIAWVLFGGNPVGYHLVNVLVHLANCWLLFALVAAISRRWRVAFLSALIYAGLPLYGVAVLWPGDADFLLTFFYLSSILCWVWHLQQRRVAFYVLSFIFFLLALLTKEFGVTLPVMLFLVDRLLLPQSVIARHLAVRNRTYDSAEPILRFAQDRHSVGCLAVCAGRLCDVVAAISIASVSALLRRYAPFLIVYALYLPLEYYIQSRSVLTNMYGYGIADHVLSNFVQYLAWLAFPWGVPEPFNYLWLVTVVLLGGFITLTKKNAALVFLGSAAVLAFLPVTLFPWFFTRYLYLAVMVTAIVIAALVNRAVTQRARARWFAPGASVALALIIFGNGLGVANVIADFAELGRQTRVPFRDISQNHFTFPDDTYLYFVNPPTITSQLSGMFFLRYGAGVHVASDESGNRRANLRAHANAYVIYFDEQRRTRELPVETELSIATHPALPVNFAASLQLEGYELARANVQRDQPVVLLLYWRGVTRIENDYIVVAQLIDTNGKVIAQCEQTPRRGQAPTSAWLPGTPVVDAIQLPIPNDALPGAYRLEIALYDAVTRQRVAIVDARGSAMTDRVVIEPLRVLE